MFWWKDDTFHPEIRDGFIFDESMYLTKTPEDLPRVYFYIFLAYTVADFIELVRNLLALVVAFERFDNELIQGLDSGVNFGGRKSKRIKIVLKAMKSTSIGLKLYLFSSIWCALNLFIINSTRCCYLVLINFQIS